MQNKSYYENYPFVPAPTTPFVPGKDFLNVREYYKGKTILLTGCTGYVGKILLEKIMRSCPDIDKIYLVIRPRQNTSLKVRIEKEIFESGLFKEAFFRDPTLRARCNEKFFPIAGDICTKGLSLSPEDRKEITSNL